MPRLSSRHLACNSAAAIKLTRTSIRQVTSRPSEAMKARAHCRSVLAPCDAAPSFFVASAARANATTVTCHGLQRLFHHLKDRVSTRRAPVQGFQFAGPHAWAHEPVACQKNTECAPATSLVNRRQARTQGPAATLYIAAQPMQCALRGARAVPKTTMVDAAPAGPHRCADRARRTGPNNFPLQRTVTSSR